MTTFERHHELGAQVREAVSRVVREFRLGESRYSLAGATLRLNSGWSAREADDVEREFIDDLVEEVGKVLTREGE